MVRANLRKVGGSVMLAIPPTILDQLALAQGAGVELSVEGDTLVVRLRRPRYSLDQLLAEEEGELSARQEMQQGRGPDEGLELGDTWQSDAAIGDELI
ncbi:AbrB/MazE/SpoVT family DNA-binding domain-containing protein [Xanthobacter autotrophicus]|uniref:AbrB/MazE/SpoVT family DNA-binding domain-containing protein n=1 Tax=Xanthobacter autotrophicus TaxID=280 RepID=UPI0024A711FA|nr:antitoxin [Xanthobacter autotrophicus]MDI4658781.1 antitoxin [Xanthobacter autotrophicus]